MMKILSIARTFVGISVVALLGAGCSGSPDESVSAATENLSGQRIDVISATFGLNCGVSRGNATGAVASACDGATSCTQTVSTGMTGGDPARGCDKDFDADYACGTVGTANSGRLAVHVPREANTKPFSLNCATMPGNTGTMTILDATYGLNCNSGLSGNVTWDVAPFCNGWGHCRYEVSSATLGDPARGCDKTFVAHYRCSSDSIVHTASAPGEANGRIASFDCQ